jgi:hypothetical protein
VGGRYPGPPLPDPSAAAIRELARNILARREFALIDDSPAPRWLKWLDHFLSWMGVLRVHSPVLYWAMLAGMSFAFLAMIAQIVWSLRAALRAHPRPPQPFSPEQPPDLAGEARQLAAAGHFLEAGHRLMIATFGLLARRSVIELRPDRSNRWIRAALPGSTLTEAVAIEIGALMEQTERRWFGRRENEPDIYDRWLSVYQRLLSSGR